MLLIKFLQKFLPKYQESKKKELKKIKNLSIFDDVWIKDNDVIHKGWIMDITRRCIIVCYGPDLKDFRFRVDKFLDQTEVTQDNKILYANEQ